MFYTENQLNQTVQEICKILTETLKKAGVDESVIQITYICPKNKSMQAHFAKTVTSKDPTVTLDLSAYAQYVALDNLYNSLEWPQGKGSEEE